MKKYKNTKHMQNLIDGYNYLCEARHQALYKGSIQAQKNRGIQNKEIQKYQTHANVIVIVVP